MTDVVCCCSITVDGSSTSLKRPAGMPNPASEQVDQEAKQQSSSQNGYRSVVLLWFFCGYGSSLVSVSHGVFLLYDVSVLSTRVSRMAKCWVVGIVGAG